MGEKFRVKIPEKKGVNPLSAARLPLRAPCKVSARPKRLGRPPPLRCDVGEPKSWRVSNGRSYKMDDFRGTNIWFGIHVVFAVRTYILEQMGVSAAMGIWLDLKRPRMVLLFDKIGCSNAKIGCFNQQTV